MTTVKAFSSSVKTTEHFSIICGILHISQFIARNKKGVTYEQETQFTLKYVHVCQLKSTFFDKNELIIICLSETICNALHKMLTWFKVSNT